MRSAASWAGSRGPAIAVLVAAVTSGASLPAQEIEPRAYSNAPAGVNFLLAGYAYSDGNVGTDASVPIEDVEVEVNSAVLAYVRTLNLWGHSGKFDVILPYAWVSASGDVAGQPRHRDVDGLGDPRLRVSALFYGGPALLLEEFRQHEPGLVVGGSIDMTVPLGQYDSDKLVNVGTNRWSFKPELGISQALGPLTLELTSGVRVYTENHDFVGGRDLEVEPLYSVQAHAIYSFTPGLWACVDALYYTGGRPVIDGHGAQRLENARLGLTLAVPLHRRVSVKLYASTDVYSKTGTETDILGIAWQFRWGGGL